MTDPRIYSPFDLELRNWDETAGTYVVAVLARPELGDLDPVTITLNEADIAKHLRALEAKDLKLKQQVALGKALADRLLPEGPIRDRFVRKVEEAGQDRGVRLRLIIRDPRLRQLPWEYTYLPIFDTEGGRNDFLVLMPQVSLVRHIPSSKPWPELAPLDRDEMRMLVVLANPSDMDELDLEAEADVIEEALSEFDVPGCTLNWQPMLENVSSDRLRRELQQKTDIFHFAGHGRFRPEGIDPKTGQEMRRGHLILVNESAGHKSEWVPAETIAGWIQPAGVRLAVLGACESGRVDGVSAWTGVAPALIGLGIPAVVAMQYNLIDVQASAFSTAFYNALAAGLSVDEAMYFGRQEIVTKSSKKQVEWGVPVLYMRSEDGVLFPPTTDESAELAEQMRLAIEQAVGIVSGGGSVTGIRIDRLLHHEGLNALNAKVKQDVGAVKDSGSVTAICIGTVGAGTEDRESEE